MIAARRYHCHTRRAIQRRQEPPCPWSVHATRWVASGEWRPCARWDGTGREGVTHLSLCHRVPSDPFSSRLSFERKGTSVKKKKETLFGEKSEGQRVRVGCRRETGKEKKKKKNPLGPATVIRGVSTHSHTRSLALAPASGGGDDRRQRTE